MERIPIAKDQEELSKLIKRVVLNQEKIVLQQDGQEVIVTPGKEASLWNKLIAMFARIVEDKLDMQKTKTRVLGTLQSKGSVKFADDFAMTDEELLQS